MLLLHEPYAFETLLNYFKEKGTPLKLCLAHFGGGNQISSSLKKNKVSEEEMHPYGVLKKNWFLQVKDMMQRFDSLYTDISYALHDKTIHKNLIAEIQNEIYGNRIMFGTDFFLTEREGPEKDTYRIFRDYAMAADKIKDVAVWDNVAHVSTEKFLNSKFYNGFVI